MPGTAEYLEMDRHPGFPLAWLAEGLVARVGPPEAAGPVAVDLIEVDAIDRLVPVFPADVAAPRLHRVFGWNSAEMDTIVPSMSAWTWQSEMPLEPSGAAGVLPS